MKASLPMTGPRLQASAPSVRRGGLRFCRLLAPPPRPSSFAASPGTVAVGAPFAGRRSFFRFPAGGCAGAGLVSPPSPLLRVTMSYRRPELNGRQPSSPPPRALPQPGSSCARWVWEPEQEVRLHRRASVRRTERAGERGLTGGCPARNPSPPPGSLEPPRRQRAYPACRLAAGSAIRQFVARRRREVGDAVPQAAGNPALRAGMFQHAGARPATPEAGVPCGFPLPFIMSNAKLHLNHPDV